MTSSKKPEVHHILQRRHKWTKPWSQATRSENLVKFSWVLPRICMCVGLQTLRQTDTQTYRPITILCFPTGDAVKIISDQLSANYRQWRTESIRPSLTANLSDMLRNVQDDAKQTIGHVAQQLLLYALACNFAKCWPIFTVSLFFHRQYGVKLELL